MHKLSSHPPLDEHQGLRRGMLTKVTMGTAVIMSICTPKISATFGAMLSFST